MKTKFYLIAILLIGITHTNAQQVIVTDDASYTTPANGAMLDVKSTSKGFMMPRVALTSLTDQTTVPTPATGLMVYNTGAGALTEKGIYFWNGTVWEKELSAGTSSTNYVKIGGDGTVTLNGSATTFNDLVVNPYVARNSGTTAPSWTLYCAPGVYSWEYKDVNTEELFFTLQMPHDYKEGTRIFPHVHWSSISAAGTSRVAWYMDYQWVNHQSSYAASTYSTISGYTIAGVSGRSLTAYEHIITPMSDGSAEGGIDGTGKTISSVLVCRLRRSGGATGDANDTFTNGSAFLLSMDFHYEIDSFGSSEPFIK